MKNNGKCPKVELTGQVQLNCEVTGRPEPETIWLKDDKMLVPDEENLNLILDMNSLTIRSFLPNDTGNYTCLKTNRGGSLAGHLHPDYVSVMGK